MPKISPQILYWSKDLAAAAESYEGGDALNSRNVWSNFALAVSENGGTATSWTVTLQGSLDGTTWTDLTTHQRAVEGNGKIKHVVDKPCSFMRVYVTALTLNTATSINIKLLAV